MNMTSLLFGGTLIFFLLVVQFHSIFEPFLILLTIAFAADGELCSMTILMTTITTSSGLLLGTGFTLFVLPALIAVFVEGFGVQWADQPQASERSETGSETDA